MAAIRQFLVLILFAIALTQINADHNYTEEICQYKSYNYTTRQYDIKNMTCTWAEYCCGGDYFHYCCNKYPTPAIYMYHDDYYSLSGWQIFGIVMGVLVFLSLTISTVTCVICTRRNQTTSPGMVYRQNQGAYINTTGMVGTTLVTHNSPMFPQPVYPVQYPTHNTAYPVQSPTNNIAHPVQSPNYNAANPVQSATNNAAYPVQSPTNNIAHPVHIPTYNVANSVQSATNNAAFPVQSPTNNSAHTVHNPTDNAAVVPTPPPVTNTEFTQL